MRKRAGLARALVLDPEIILFDEPDSGLDPVRTAYLNQLIVDLNAQIDATFLIVTHDINTARTVPDNIGLLYHRHLAMFGPARDAAVQRGAGRPAVPQRPAGRARSAWPRRRTPTSWPPSRARSCRRCRRSRCSSATSDGTLRRHRARRPAPGAGTTASRRRPGSFGATATSRCTEAVAAMSATGHRCAAAERATCSRSSSTSLRALPRRPFQGKEFIQQAWFIASVTILPTALVSIPFGAVIALQLGSLTRQLGAQSLHRRGVACSRSCARPARSSRRC